MARILIGGKTDGAGFHALAHELLHFGISSGVACALHRGFAHDVMAHGDVPDQRARH